MTSSSSSVFSIKNAAVLSGVSPEVIESSIGYGESVERYLERYLSGREMNGVGELFSLRSGQVLRLLEASFQLVHLV